MESVEITVRRIQPQPLATVGAEAFKAWSQAVLDRIAHLDETRSANHPIGTRLRNMASFITKQTKRIARPQGAKVTLKAGEFYWFLCRLLQREEKMKAALNTGDPFVKAIDPGLRDLLKQGWDLPKWPPGYWKMIDQLHSKMQAGREQARSNKRLQPTGAPSKAHRQPKAAKRRARG